MSEHQTPFPALHLLIQTLADSDRRFPTAVKGPSIAFAILFAISGICHVFQSQYVAYLTFQLLSPPV
jgi:hypothetical protein